MEEIEVGEYGRTNFGKIIRFAWLESSEGKRYEDKVLLINEDILSNDFYYFHRGEKIAKHSKQLIDLIEVGDILKIKISEEWVEKQDTIKFVVVGQTYTITEIKECLENGLFKIIQILTKEQVETNCYKVGGEDGN